MQNSVARPDALWERRGARIIPRPLAVYIENP